MAQALTAEAAHASSPDQDATSAPISPSSETAVLAGRGVSLLAALTFLVVVFETWPLAVDSSKVAALLLVLATVALLALAAVVICARTERFRSRLDIAVFGTGLVAVGVSVQQAVFQVPRVYPSDEGRLTQLATAAVANGQNPYSIHWPAVAQFAGNTPLMGGGAVTTFGYPPLFAEVGAGLGHIWAPLGAPAAVGTLGLLATAVIAFVLLPARWRSLAVPVTFGLTPLLVWAVNGHPVMLALPLLCVASWRWTRVGESGRLGITGVAQAACLGLAAATQQLAWFVAVAIVLALWLVRRDDSGRRGGLVVARYVAVAAIAFVVVNMPFIVATPGRWWAGVTSVLTQHAAPGGQGLISLSTELRTQAGNLGYFSVATLLLFVGVLVVAAVGFRVLAPALPVLVMVTFVAATRSQGEYFIVFAPVWLVWLFGCEPAAVHAARPLSRRLSSLLSTPARRAAGVVLALAPAVVVTAVAVAQPGPLVLRVNSEQVANGRLHVITVVARNRSDHRIRPTFYLDPASHLRSLWRVARGPTWIAPGEVAHYTLIPGPLGPRRVSPTLRLWALSDDPQALSSATLR